jgi:hypothetical protein
VEVMLSLDRFLLEKSTIAFRRFPIKSMEDVVFGFVVGSVVVDFSYLITMMERQPTLDEMKEFWQIIDRRALEIRGKIKVALGK